MNNGKYVDCMTKSRQNTTLEEDWLGTSVQGVSDIMVRAHPSTSRDLYDPTLPVEANKHALCHNGTPTFTLHIHYTHNLVYISTFTLI